MAIIQQGAFLTSAGVIRCNIFEAYKDQLGITGIDYSFDTTPDNELSSGAVAGGWYANNIALFQETTSTLVDFLGAKAFLRAPKPAPAAGISAFNDSGNVVGQPLPMQVSGLITTKTAAPGRHASGRMYIPFPVVPFEGPLETPTLAYGVAMQRLANNLASQFGVAGLSGAIYVFTPVLYRRRLLTWDTITNARANLRWATQRRRGDYGKPNPAVIL